MAVGQTTLTVEAFWEQYAGKPFELIEGEIFPVSPTGYLNASVERRASTLFGTFVDDNNLGDVVGGEAGFWLGPNTMRGADVAFISNSKLALLTDDEKYLPFAPDIALEVVSSNDTAEEIQNKVNLYLNAGTLQVWILYPRIRQIVVHYPDGTTKRFTEHDIIDGGSVLPGFSAAVADFFPPHRQSDPED
jgi:Uma2 family endonuclease